MLTKKKRKNAIRELMRKIPEGDPIGTIMSYGGPHVKNIAYDRTAAIVGPIFLEQALKRAIILHFEPDLCDPEFKYLFDQDEAPYREFASRLKLAKALGIVSNEQYEKLEIVRQIRNLFAHANFAIDFDMQEIKDFCHELHVNIGHSAVPAAFPANRFMFVFSVVNLYLALNGYKKPAPPAASQSLP
jgi:hypothetical protein